MTTTSLTSSPHFLTSAHSLPLRSYPTSSSTSLPFHHVVRPRLPRRLTPSCPTSCNVRDEPFPFAVRIPLPSASMSHTFMHEGKPYPQIHPLAYPSSRIPFLRVLDAQRVRPHACMNNTTRYDALVFGPRRSRCITHTRSLSTHPFDASTSPTPKAPQSITTST